MMLNVKTNTLGNYTIYKGKIVYLGNRILKSIGDVKNKKYKSFSSSKILKDLAANKHYYHLNNIDNAVFNASIEYFRSIGAIWCNLPITTKMISSPGEIYAGQKLNYTSDAVPISLDWFNVGKIFLSESSQFYLELRLIMSKIKQVYSIYNSFRKEKMDFSHLAEFQHVEYEGRVSFEQNIKVFIGLLRYITDFIIKNNYKDLRYYIPSQEIKQLVSTFDDQNIQKITFCDAMDILSKELNDRKYSLYTLKYFGAYEEVALTRILNKHCLVVDFPVEEIPFYHDVKSEDKEHRAYAKNADLILLGYREVIGSGQRIANYNAIVKKAEFFNLPSKDYEPYIKLRKMPKYKTTCGFGMGWQRYTQWLLRMPFIWQMCHTPRGEHIPYP